MNAKAKQDIQKLYKTEEHKSLSRKTKQASSLKISNAQIREIVNDLLSSQERVLLSSLARVLAEQYHESKDVFKTRVRIQFAVKTQSSGLKLEKMDGRVWIVRK